MRVIRFISWHCSRLHQTPTHVAKSAIYAIHIYQYSYLLLQLCKYMSMKVILNLLSHLCWKHRRSSSRGNHLKAVRENGIYQYFLWVDYLINSLWTSVSGFIDIFHHVYFVQAVKYLLVVKIIPHGPSLMSNRGKAKMTMTYFHQGPLQYISRSRCSLYLKNNKDLEKSLMTNISTLIYAICQIFRTQPTNMGQDILEIV